MTSKPGLLDVNVLISLLDPAHQFHEAAHAWFARARRWGWATCPLTENGCIRIMSHPGYPCPGLTAEKVRGILTELNALQGHEFWSDSVSIVEGGKADLARVKAKQITDVYLVALAAARKGRLITFDRTIPWQAVTGCRADDVEIIEQI